MIINSNKNKFVLLFFAFLSSVFVYSQDLDKMVEGMSYEEKAAQVLMVSVGGSIELPAYNVKHFEGITPGAILLFKFNLADTPQKLRHFVDSCNTGFYKIADSSKYKFPPLIAIDNEGGRVYRTKGLTSILPSAKDVAYYFTSTEAEKLYYLTGVQMKELGLSVNLAPVSEKTQNGEESILGDRVFSESIEITHAFSKSFVSGMQKANVSCVAKHFPGNGSEDLHSKSSSINCDYNEFLKNYVEPFLQSIKDAHIVMVSHVKVSCLDNKPYCFSKMGIDFLRNQLGFSGLILTDDLVMKALQTQGKSISELAILTLEAGCDMLMYSGRDVRLLVNAISQKAKTNTVFEKRLNQAVLHVLEAKKNAGLIDSAGNIVNRKSFDLTKFMNAKNDANKLVKSKMPN